MKTKLYNLAGRWKLQSLLKITFYLKIEPHEQIILAEHWPVFGFFFPINSTIFR
jgi:hypothetical protein